MQSNQLYTIKIEVCRTLLIQKNVKEKKNSKIIYIYINTYIHTYVYIYTLYI